MGKTTRRLGRGLDSLVSDLRVDLGSPAGEGQTSDNYSVDESELSDDKMGGFRAVKKGGSFFLAVEALTPNPFQPRGSFDEGSLNALAASIRRNGILQPIPVRRVGEAYQIIAGERRWTAARRAGLAEVPVVVREATDEQMLELALIENLHREDLNPVDRAKAYRNFCGRFDVRPEELADRLGEDRTTVVNYLRLLELPENIRALVTAGRLSMGHARCLLSVSEESQRQKLAEAILKNELSVRAVEEIVRRGRALLEARARRAAGDREGRMTAPHIADLRRRFEEALKTRVQIQEGKRKGTGRVIIAYYSLEDFDRLAERMGVETER